MQNQLNELASNGFRITINRKMIAPKVAETSNAIRNQIRNELKGKLFSIVFDVCKKRTFAVLGVSAFFMIDGKTIARSLGMVHLTERHRGPYLANVIEKLLDEYDALLKQVYTATTDKAANMDNTIRHLTLNANDGINEHIDETEDMDSNNEYNYEFDESFDALSNEEMAMENQIELENELNNDSRYEDLVKELTSELRRRNNFLSLINQVDCCAHKIQLAVHSAIDKSNAKPTICAVREMTKLLRTTVVNIQFRKLAPKCVLPPLCVETRWNSDFMMVIIVYLSWNPFDLHRDLSIFEFFHHSLQLESFMKLKNVVIQLSTDREFGDQFETNDDFWEQITEIILVLKPLYIATKEMQKVGYGLSDFYISWLRIEKGLARVNSNGAILNLAVELTKALEARRSDLLNTPSMLAALYLDPRVKFKLDSFQKELAVLHLKKLYIRMEELKANPAEVVERKNTTLDELNEEYALLQNEFEEIDTGELMLSLARYDEIKHIDFNREVMDFWKSHKDEFPAIYRLANVIHAIPAGQCFEERNFSSFSYIRSAKRAKLSAENVKNILNVRLNKEVFYEHKQKKINDILCGKVNK